MARNLLALGSAWLGKVQAEHASEEVHYLRGDSAVAVRAVVGRSEFEHADAEGHVTRLQPKDFLILAAELLVDDVPAEPAPGDRVVQGGLEDGHVYEVMDLPGVPCWSWSDPLHAKYRIHTKFVGRMPLSDE